MSLLSISIQRGGDITLIDDTDIFQVTTVQRVRGGVKGSESLRQALESSLNKALRVPVHFYTDDDGNDYVIAGVLPTGLPTPRADREAER